MFEEKSKPSTEKERLEKAFLAQTAELIVEKAGYDVNWKINFNSFGFGEVLNEIPRFEKSRQYNDPDYPEKVYEALELAYKKDRKKAIEMAIHILKKNLKKIKKEELVEYPTVEAFLENKDLTDSSQMLPKVSVVSTKYLDISDVPDPFYRDLIDLINKCYSYRIYPAVSVFSRKLLENLLIDILRKKYGEQRSELFLNKTRKRFCSFNILLKNFSGNLDDFKSIIPDLDEEFIKNMDTFREAGNSSAHSLELNVKKEELDEKQKDLEHIVKILIRIYNNITPNSQG